MRWHHTAGLAALAILTSAIAGCTAATRPDDSLATMSVETADTLTSVPADPTLDPSPTAEPATAEATPEPTDPPDELTPTPTVEPTAAPVDTAFDPSAPFRFCDDDACVDWANPVEMTVNMAFMGEWMAITPVIRDPEADLDEIFPTCDSNALITNAKDGDSESEVWYKSIMYIHSGRCRGRWHPAEVLRVYFEGGYYNPNDEQRQRRLEEIAGKTMTFDQGDGLVAFEVVEAIHLTGDAVADYAEDPGSLDRFFDTGVQPGKHETFMIFCGSNGIQVANPLDFFNDRYILRLQVATEDTIG